MSPEHPWGFAAAAGQAGRKGEQLRERGEIRRWVMTGKRKRAHTVLTIYCLSMVGKGFGGPFLRTHNVYLVPAFSPYFLAWVWGGGPEQVVSIALARRVVCALRFQVLGFRKPRDFILLLLERLFCETVDTAGASFRKKGRISEDKTRRAKHQLLAQNRTPHL